MRSIRFIGRSSQAGVLLLPFGMRDRLSYPRRCGLFSSSTAAVTAHHRVSPLGFFAALRLYSHGRVRQPILSIWYRKLGRMGLQRLPYRADFLFWVIGYPKVRFTPSFRRFSGPVTPTCNRLGVSYPKSPNSTSIRI